MDGFVGIDGVSSLLGLLVFESSPGPGRGATGTSVSSGVSGDGVSEGVAGSAGVSLSVGAFGSVPFKSRVESKLSGVTLESSGASGTVLSRDSSGVVGLAGVPRVTGMS